MAELKTKATAVSVEKFIDKLADEGVRDDCYALIRMMQRVAGEPPVLWGPSIVGFGKYHYKYDSGHEGDMPVAAFSPRKGNLTVYAYTSHLPDLLKKLGKHKSSKACIYIKKLADIDMKVLEKIVVTNIKDMRKKYPD